ncbi:glycosyl hydrolase 115 family protein [Asticcacaulis sp. ZE23SCel15]|uniref:glycosyl hydrolase 115 family protein n=1 Tax=Asticcacaulis sp. ZE23SCel15 TaxID=3059027 RepID=UPI00265DEA93|nr:glycosyl hydrolase 115 family protein [Asticcacaulis sp. ZE23SCel15]WKL57158.1 glycosyl hydrolase 115 family protein [Asticcacaulis sp. ZE23SCel15]
MKIAVLSVGLMVLPWAALACETPVSVCEQSAKGSFNLIRGGQPVAVYVDTGADKAVRYAADDFQADLRRVGGKPAALIEDISTVKGPVVIIGVIGQSPVIDKLITDRKINVDNVRGQWEAFSQTVVDNPVPGVKQALVIAGSDRRGAIFGTYDLSAKIGVSPWYWWADVPVEKKSEVYVTAGAVHDQPKVKYRGFFINDEEPAFGNWAREKFGGINAKLYEHVFELNLRLKGNYLWPAMWGKAFNDDDPHNTVLADEMGVIIGTSHHEPMARAHDEWHRNKDKGVTGGKWDYNTNAANLRTFWRGGIERIQRPDGSLRDNIITLGMRGDGDEAMTEGTATQLLETIVADQRKTIADVTGKPASETPQVWALYKEVQDYYDQGMTVPDDVILLFADDNWGQIRRLPTKDRDRKGGYGVYYHFDYVGGPRNYKWLNTNQIEKAWQQMDLAYASGADQLWIVNVGDIKPMEYPLSFFMDMAWNPQAMTPEALKAYPERWAAQQFGKKYSVRVGKILTEYSQYNARRKPELLNEATFNLENYYEWGSVTAEYSGLISNVSDVEKDIKSIYDDAFFQLVRHPVLAGFNIYRLYESVALNRYYAGFNDPLAIEFAEEAKAAFETDQWISDAYHKVANGKWNHMMSQTRIGYTGWQQPEQNVMPKVVEINAKTATGRAADSPANVLHEGWGPFPYSGQPFMEEDGYVSIEAEHFARKVDGKGINWTVIPHLGRTLSSVITMPQNVAPSDPKTGMRLEYDLTLTKDADAQLHIYLVPTLDTRGQGGLKFGISVDDGPVLVQTFNLIPDQPDWNKAVSDNAHVVKVPLKGLKAGVHTLKFWRIDGNVVLQKLVLDTGGLKPTYLGPPESPVAP